MSRLALVCRLTCVFIALCASSSAMAVLLALPEPKPATASANVRLLAPFKMTGLNRSRQVRLYLPPDYHLSQQRYPVLYLHDGQNVFDEATAYAGEWGVDETLNQLAAQGWLKLIVVAVDNGGEHRMQEYSGWDNPRFGKAEGEAYINFIRNELKPYVDRHFRTLPEAADTGIMGSSMGGLISHYALFNRPGTFSKAGIFSPSYWYSEAVYAKTNMQVLPKQSRISLLVGTKEGREMVSNTLKMADLLRSQGLANAQLSVKVVPEAEHNEAFWRSEFADAVLYLFNPAAYYLRAR